MPIPKPILFLEPLRHLSDAAWLLMRLCIGAFLVWGVWDNIADSDRMAEFARFLSAKGFAWPEAMARLSAWAQFFCGIGFMTGLLTRWAGLLCAFNFMVALVMVDAAGGIRSAFPAAMLVLFGLYAATHGAGSFAVDRLFGTHPVPASGD
jgi:putative oxidoreductase